MYIFLDAVSSLLGSEILSGSGSLSEMCAGGGVATRLYINGAVKPSSPLP